MAGVKLDKDSVEYQMFNDFWKIFQEYYYPDRSDEKSFFGKGVNKAFRQLL